MSVPTRFLQNTPTTVALAYALFGIVWIFTTDQLIFVFVEDPTLRSQMQTAKGWVFVAISTLVIYGLVLYSQHDLVDTNERLDRALKQTSILHRILRHNLRNSCTVIKGNANLLAEHHVDCPNEPLETIENQNNRLLELSQKSRMLRDIVLGRTDHTTQLDLVDRIETQVGRLRDEYPEVELEVDLPESIPIETDSRIEDAIYELLENGVEHNEKSSASIHVRARSAVDGSVSVEIADDGPGMPEMERKVIEVGYEQPMFHSQGLGLWIAKTLLTNIGGDIHIVDNEPRGTIVGLSIPK